ncbi:MAG: Gfo/Idh/MocA family oxidoreductase [candidate division KSB1 bacterium]|nr:Gfo/Idh/MocA family oxidoreductase [candidate division KSB1 bacterium]
MTRRSFLKTGAAAAALSAFSYGRVLGANDTVRVGIIGLNSKGADHIVWFRKLAGVRVAALCDVDQSILNREAAKLHQQGERPALYRDMRRLFDAVDIDAVVIATPNHWHTLAAVWAMQSGKDVYVEKPVSHNIREGQKLVQAARKYNRIVQSGMQNRSDICLRAVKDYLKEGRLGRILWAHGLWFKRRDPIGKTDGPVPIPPEVDYDLWCGPAPLQPLMRQNLHYDWHWFWETGNGDMANLGVHQIDDCRFLCDLVGAPRRVVSLGARWNFDDDGQTPNTQLAWFEYDIPLIIEIRNLPVSKGSTVEDHVLGVRAGEIIMCENGYFAGGRGGGWVYDRSGKRIKQFPGDGGEGHAANFIEAVRKRDRSLLHSEAEEGHFSALAAHVANISWRLGRRSTFAQAKTALQNCPQALERLESIEAHVAANGVDLEKEPLRLGAVLTFDPVKHEFIGDMSYEADMFLDRIYREPFRLPTVL